MVMTLLVPVGRWPLDSSSRGVAATGERSPSKREYMSLCQIRALRANNVTTTLEEVTPNFRPTMCICCPRLVMIVPLKVNHIIMVL